MDKKKFEQELKKYVKDRMSKYDLVDHDFAHIERVVTYGKLIMKEEGVSDEIYNDVLVALYCHDLGRADDTKDDAHGLRSAEIFEKELYPKYSFLDFESIMFAICHHQDFPTENKDPVVEAYDVSTSVNKLVARIMWDADRLDLIRLIEFRGKLNKNYLQTRFAKMFADSKEHHVLYD